MSELVITIPTKIVLNKELLQSFFLGIYAGFIIVTIRYLWLKNEWEETWPIAFIAMLFAPVYAYFIVEEAVENTDEEEASQEKKSNEN